MGPTFSDLAWDVMDTVGALAIVGVVVLAVWVIGQFWPMANGDDDRG